MKKGNIFTTIFIINRKIQEVQVSLSDLNVNSLSNTFNSLFLRQKVKYREFNSDCKLRRNVTDYTFKGPLRKHI